MKIKIKRPHKRTEYGCMVKSSYPVRCSHEAGLIYAVPCRSAARARCGRGRGRYRPVYSGTLIYDRSKLRGFTACLYWPATNACLIPPLPPLQSHHPPSLWTLPLLFNVLKTSMFNIMNFK